MRFLVHVLVTAASLGAAAALVPGIRSDGVLSLVLAALVFGVVNALIKPVLKLLSCPLILLTLGLFTLVLNGVLLLLAARLGGLLGIGFHVDGFWAAFLGALVVSVVSTLLSWLVGDDRRR